MLWRPRQVTPEEVEETAAGLRNRNGIYKDRGHDRAEAVRFIIDSVDLSGKRILDIGTGQGFTAVEIARRGIPVKTVDLSEESLQKAFFTLWQNLSLS